MSALEGSVDDEVTVEGDEVKADAAEPPPPPPPPPPPRPEATVDPPPPPPPPPPPSGLPPASPQKGSADDEVKEAPPAEDASKDEDAIDWQALLDTHLITPKLAASAAICSVQDGQPAARSPDFEIRPEEIARVAAHLESPDDLAAVGAMLAGVEHVYVYGEARSDFRCQNGEIYLRNAGRSRSAREKTGVFFCSAPKQNWVVVACHDHTILQGPTCIEAAKNLADVLGGSEGLPLDVFRT